MRCEHEFHLLLSEREVDLVDVNSTFHEPSYRLVDRSRRTNGATNSSLTLAHDVRHLLGERMHTKHVAECRGDKHDVRRTHALHKFLEAPKVVVFASRRPFLCELVDLLHFLRDVRVALANECH